MQAIRECGGVISNPFVTSELGGCRWSTSPSRKTAFPPFAKDWMKPVAGLNRQGKSRSHRDSILEPSIP